MMWFKVLYTFSFTYFFIFDVDIYLELFSKKKEP